MYYHASQKENITILKPHKSNHNKPLVYLSKKRENTLVYLSNAVEKYCKEIGFNYDGTYYKWASYGFTKHGILRIEEYYPNAIYDTYKGVSGYIYSTEFIEKFDILIDIPDVIISEDNIPVSNCEYIPDAYEAIMDAVKSGKMKIVKYEENSKEMLGWIEKTIKIEYQNATEHPEYREFLKGKFNFLN